MIGSADIAATGMNITVTPGMIHELGTFLVVTMRNANFWTSRGYDEYAMKERGKILGMIKALRIQGVPVEDFRQETDSYYAAVKIGDVTFSVEEEELEEEEEEEE